MSREDDQPDIDASIEEMLKGDTTEDGVSEADKVRRKPRETEDAPIDIDNMDETPPEVGADDGIAAEMEALRAERDEYKDRFARALAEAENSRKRADRERREAENYGGSRMARDMLPVYDNLQRAVAAIPEEGREANAALIEGLQLTLRELKAVFEKHGISVLSPDVGDRFDPKIHEAMFEAPVPGTNAGDIIQVMAEGFLIHDRLLRAAQVGVSSTPK